MIHYILKHLKDFFTTNIIEKSLAITLTIFAWFAVQLATDTTITLNNIEVQIIPPADQAVLSPNQPKVSIQLRGTEHDLQGINPNHIKVTIRLPENKTHSHSTQLYTINLSAKDVVLPTGCSIVSLTPESLNIKTDRLIKARKPVLITTAGAISNEFSISLNTIPPMIEVVGPASIVNEIFSVKTVPVQLESSMTESFSISDCELASPPHRIQYERLRVNLSAIILRKRIHRIFESYGVNYLIPPNFQYHIEPAEKINMIKVSVTGDLTVVHTLNQIDCYIDFSHIKHIPENGIVSLPVNAILNNDMSCLSCVPSTLKFKLTPKNEPLK